MTNCTSNPIRFPGVKGRKIEAIFNGHVVSQGRSAPKNRLCAEKLSKKLQEKSFCHHPKHKTDQSAQKLERATPDLHLQGRSCNIRVNGCREDSPTANAKTALPPMWRQGRFWKWQKRISAVVIRRRAKLADG